MKRGRKKTLTDAAEARIVALALAGSLTHREIGAAVGYSHQTVRDVLRRRGVPEPRCPHCGRPMRRGPRVRTCGAPACRLAHDAPLRRERLGRADRVCAACGGAFSPAGRETVCGPCRLKQAARPVRPRGLDHAECVRLHREGLSQREIARRMGRSQTAVGDALRAAGMAPVHRHRK